MSVVLPLPFIRPFGSKCFAGGLLHIHSSGFRTRGLLELKSIGISRIPDGCVAGPTCHSMFKTPERKESSSRKGGTLADNRPILLDAEKGKMVGLEGCISGKKLLPFSVCL